MLQTCAVLLVIGLIIVGILGLPTLRRQRRQRLKRCPLPPLWRAYLEKALPIYPRLSADERLRLQGHLQVFLAEKQFIGCQGLQITEEMRVTIAAVACLLLLNERGTYFPRLKSILVYPRGYVVEQAIAQGPHLIEERQEARLGESWTQDQVILSWEEIQADWSRWRDGHNLILHEFAHQLDQEDGSGEGVPILPQRQDYAAWRQVFAREYQQFQVAVQRQQATVLDPYGATHPAEFFAVATEAFFEQPSRLRQRHPAIYQQLQRYYQLDPEQWH